MSQLTHPDVPFALELRGQEVVACYPGGATAIATRTDWLAMQILIRLDSDEKSQPLEAGEQLIDRAVEQAKSAQRKSRRG